MAVVVIKVADTVGEDNIENITITLDSVPVIAKDAELTPAQEISIWLVNKFNELCQQAQALDDIVTVESSADTVSPVDEDTLNA